MTISNIDVEATIDKVKTLIAAEKDLSPALKASLDVHDRGTKNIFITGSNARFLNSEIATSLRGRTVSYEVFPLSFREYLTFKDIVPDLHSTKSIALINHHLANHLKHGGFPEVTGYDDALRNRVLQEYFNVMIYRDLLERYEIKNLPALKFFLKRIMSSATKLISVNNIYNGLKSSTKIQDR